jgi:tripartite-type tricarboxylate transporter receptor subunit TctC
MVAPPGTPPAITTRLSGAIAEALKEPQVAKWLTETSAEAIGSTPAQMDAFMKRERERWGGVIRATGTTAE